MPSNQTPNYQLNQWEATDQVKRTDFNADNAKIDAALNAIAVTVPKISSGTYAGNGLESRFINVGFTPKAVYVCTADGLAYSTMGYGNTFGGLALTGAPTAIEYQNIMHTSVAISTSGFTVYQNPFDNVSGVRANQSGITYHYIAFTW